MLEIVEWLYGEGQDSSPALSFVQSRVSFRGVFPAGLVPPKVCRAMDPRSTIIGFS